MELFHHASPFPHYFSFLSVETYNHEIIIEKILKDSSYEADYLTNLKIDKKLVRTCRRIST